jgi:hypothetical protein
MQRIYFCTGTSFLTGDDIALALLEYAWALSQHSRHDLVQVPTRSSDGSSGRSTLLIGPESQISAEDVRSSLSEVRDEELVLSLRARTSQLRDPLPGLHFDEDGEEGELPEPWGEDTPTEGRA